MAEPGVDIWAHSENLAGLRHRLDDHLRGTAALASRFAEPFGGAALAWWLALLHDAGKASCDWQQRLLEVTGTGRPVGVDHKLLGARLARERGLGSFALAVAGHHGGLASPSWLKGKLGSLTGAEKSRERDALEVLGRVLPEIGDAAHVQVPDSWHDPLVREMAIRLCFSALCDADFLDTAAHFSGSASPAIRAETDFRILRDRYERGREALLSGRHPSPVDAIREAVYQACLRASASQPGVFRLAAPTGSGKTISAGSFALHHAAAHKLRRVVVAVPFLTITEQNAQVYRDLLESPGAGGIVLEHHSGADLDRPGRRWGRLAAENWDAPFVVTTTVRLFESLFDRRPAAMRRLHRLAGAVIVLDEVQSLPHQMLIPILDALRTLVSHFGATVVLASATQPDFWFLSPWRQLAGNADHPGSGQPGVSSCGGSTSTGAWILDPGWPGWPPMPPRTGRRWSWSTRPPTRAPCLTPGVTQCQPGMPGTCRPGCAGNIAAGSWLMSAAVSPDMSRYCWSRRS